MGYEINASGKGIWDMAVRLVPRRLQKIIASRDAIMHKPVHVPRAKKAFSSGLRKKKKGT
jgi:hypothetical protein